MQLAEIAKTGTATHNSDARLPNPSKPSATPTTQANTTSKSTFTKNLDGNGYKVEGAGIVDDVVKGRGNHAIQFGMTENQIYHAFLTDDLGLK